MAPTLRAQLLGGFRVILNQQDISASFSERVKVLFAYLLLNSETPISRKQLAFTFWPDSTESQARTNLRNLLHHLRNSLQASDSFLDVDNKTIKWKSNAHMYLDVQSFVKTISFAESCGDIQDRISYLQKAIKHYRGELLPDLYEDWLLKQREELHQAFINTLLDLGNLLEDDRRYPEAITVMNRLIRSDPLNELAYQRSMRIHALNKDRAGALKVYHACAAALRRELDVEPAQETQTYYTQILQLDETRSVVTKKEVSPEINKLVGRQLEWERLRKAWQAIVQGKSGAVFILGEAGVGKTRLSNEMAAWTRRQGIYTAFAQCYPGEGELPYAPVITWLRTPEFEKELADLDDLWQAELARFLPEYADLTGSGAVRSEMDHKWQRRRLFEALARGLLGHREPRLLILDDVQWSDQDTLDFIHYLLHYDETAPVMFILTARTEEITSKDPVNQFRVLLQAKGCLDELELKPLTKEEVLELATDLARDPIQADRLDRLYADSEGNPLFIVEMMRSDEASIPASLPLSIRSLLEYRLNQLSSSASDLVGIASAIGREFSYQLLGAACGMDLDTMVNSLDELWQRRIVQTQQGDNYNFTHGKLREAAYESLSAARRRLNHGRIAEALLSMPGKDASLGYGLTANHFELAGKYDQAVDLYIRAANASRRVFANRVARSHLENALSLISEYLDGDGEQIRTVMEIREALGDICEITGDREIALENYFASLKQVSAGDNLRKARLLGKIAKIQAAVGGYEGADERFIQAVDALGKRPDESDFDWWRAWLDIQIERVWMFYNLADIEGMESTLEALLPVIKRLNAQDKLIAYQFNLVGLHCRRDRYRLDQITKRLSRETLTLCKQHNNSEYLIRATIGYGLVNLWSGDLDNGGYYLEEGLNLSEQAGDVINQIIALTYLAYANRLLNNPDGCQAFAEHALALSEREDEPTYAASARANLGWVAWRHEKLSRAKELSLKALEEWSEYYPFRWLGLWTLIDINLGEGQLAEAVELARQLTDPRQQVLPEQGQDKLARVVETFEQGNVSQASQILLQVIDWAKEHNYL